MSSRYLTWQHGGGLILGDGLSTGPASPGGTAERQLTGHAGTDPADPAGGVSGTG
jgi:hypothetical protein